MFFKCIEKHVNLETLKTDFRKIGVNFVTAGTAGLFITRVIYPSLAMNTGSTWMVILGAAVLYWGSRRRRTKNE